MTEYLLSHGVEVVATARKVDDLDDLVTRYPGGVTILPLDVTDGDSIDHAVQDAIAHAGYLDVLVNNAGYGVCGAVEEVSEDEYMGMFNTNFFGLVNMTKALLPMFRERRSGAIINMSSIGGLIGMPGWGFYNATKFALEGLSQALYDELAPLGIRVMVVEPGAFRTDFLGRSGKLASRQISDYNPTINKVREYFQEQSGHQPGDPQRAVEAIVAAISSPEPPRHLVLGKTAFGRYQQYLQQQAAELSKWQRTSEGTDFPQS